MVAARSASSKKSLKNGRTASRLSFAKITDTLTVPDLLALQTESFDWLVGNDAWKARSAEAKAAGNDSVPETTGLDEMACDLVGISLCIEPGEACYIPLAHRGDSDNGYKPSRCLS